MNRDMPLDGLGVLIVLRDPDPIEINDAPSFLDKHLEQFSRLAISANCLGHTDQRLVARHRRLLGRRETQLGRFAHARLDAATLRLDSFLTDFSSNPDGASRIPPPA